MKAAAKKAILEAEKHRAEAQLSEKAKELAEKAAKAAKEEADRDFASHSKLNSAALQEAREKIDPNSDK